MIAEREMPLELGIDIIKFVFVALGTKKELHHDIQKYYQQKETEFYSFYRESEYFNIPMFQSLTTKNMEMVKKIIGIMMWENENDWNFTRSTKLIKKGYKETYNYVNQRKAVDVQEYLNKISRQLNRPDKAPTLPKHVAIFLYMCEYFDKEYNIFDPMTQWLMGMLSKDEVAFDNEEEVISRNIKRYKQRIESDELEYKFPLKNEMKVSELIDNNVVEQKTIPLLTKEAQEEELQQRILDKGITRPFLGYTSFLRTLGLNGRDIMASHKINRRQIQSMLSHYHMLKKDKMIKESEKEVYLASCIAIFSLVEEYKETREQYLDRVTDKFYHELHKMQLEIEKEKNDFQEKKDELNRTQKELQRESQGYKGQMRSLEKSLSETRKQNVQLQKEKEELEDHKKELQALREYVFSLKQEIEYTDETMGIDDLVAKLDQKRIAIIGGHINWQNKLKDKLKSATFITPDQEGVDFSFLNNMDAVFLQTGYLNHGIYYKVQSIMSNNDIPMYYLSGKDNLKLTIQEIAEKF